MKQIGKTGAKILLCVACMLLALSIAFSAYSFARYISQVNKTGGAKPAPIECEVEIGGALDSFINAPYIQNVGGNTEAIRMNSWTDAIVTLSNNGHAGINYTYGFVFYMPQEFAECMMFQMLELTPVSRDTPSASTRFDTSEIVKASRIYRLGNAGKRNEIIPTHNMNDDEKSGFEIVNEYQSFVDKNELMIDTASSRAELQTVTTKMPVARTFMSYDGDDMLLSPVKFSKTEELKFYKITVSLDVRGMTPPPTETEEPTEPTEPEESEGDGENEEQPYLLKEQGSLHRYVFRLVPRKMLPSVAKDEWQITDYFVNAEGESTTEPTSQPESGNDDFEFKWTATDTADENGIKYKLQARVKKSADDGSAVWGDFEDVKARQCVGMTNPCKVAAVFTQSDR